MFSLYRPGLANDHRADAACAIPRMDTSNHDHPHLIRCVSSLTAVPVAGVLVAAHAAIAQPASSGPAGSQSAAASIEIEFPTKPEQTREAPIKSSSLCDFLCTLCDFVSA